MKNITDEKPSDSLMGRTSFTANRFINMGDINGKTILNIGCGFGWFEYFALNNNVGQIVAMEPFEQDLTTVEKYLSDNRLVTKVGSALEIPYSDSSFNTITSWEVLEHIPKGTEKKMFNEVNRVLKPGGIFYISTPYNNIISNIFDPAWWLIGHRHYSLEKVEKYAQDAGFEIKEVVIKGGWWELSFVFNLYISKWIFRHPPYLIDFFKRVLEKEYSKNTGFTNIQFKFIKVNSQ